MQNTAQSASSTDAPFLTIKAMAKKYASAGFTVGSLRWIAFNRNSNGFSSAFVKVGAKLLVDEAAFVACVRGQSQAQRAAA